MSIHPEASKALDSAIKAAGGSKMLASALGLSPSVIGNWRRRDGGIPPAQLPKVARVTGLAVHQLRPDLFDVPHDSAAASVAVPHIPAMQAAE